MNPIKLWKIYRKANKLANLLQEGQMNKALWKSKTFWFNILTGAAEVANIIPLPLGTALIVTNVINIGLRMVTSKGVTVLGEN